MKAITDEIDHWFSGQFGCIKRTFGYSEMMLKGNQPIPVTIPDREQVALNDDFEVMTWIRLMGLSSGNEVDGNDWAFGLQEGLVQTATLRMVLAHKVDFDEGFIHSVLKHFPRTLTIDGYQIVAIKKPGLTVDVDHEVVYRTELGETAYEKHRFTWNLYAISFEVEFIPCEVE
jgi:hypothetical protein